MSSDSAVGRKSQVDSFPFLASRHFLNLIRMTDPACTGDSLSGFSHERSELSEERNDPHSSALQIKKIRQNSLFIQEFADLPDTDPIALQIIPQKAEEEDAVFFDDDPLAEEDHSPLPGVVHRYPDRVLLYMTHRCAVHCRFCTRRRKVSDPFNGTAMENFDAAFLYIQKNIDIKEVILSGGDPLTLADEQIHLVLRRLKSINHLKSIRIHSRIPSANPRRITEELCRIFADHYPLTMVTHFNHPREITTESEKAVRLLRMSGVHVLNQSVLLKGINDKPEIMEELVLSLTKSGIQPYYLHQCDEVKGISHFRTDIQTGIDIIRYLRGRNPGISIPRFVIDLPGGGGKIPLEYDYSLGDGFYESASGSVHRVK